MALLAALLTITAGTAFAHARMLKAEPANGARVSKPPRVVRLWFNEELDQKRSMISVWDGHGRRVDDGKGGLDLNDLERRSLVARLKSLRTGPYVVKWRAVSADDLNVKEGTTRFVVRPP